MWILSQTRHHIMDDKIPRSKGEQFSWKLLFFKPILCTKVVISRTQQCFLRVTFYIAYYVRHHFYNVISSAISLRPHGKQHKTLLYASMIYPSKIDFSQWHNTPRYGELTQNIERNEQSSNHTDIISWWEINREAAVQFFFVVMKKKQSWHIWF
jgi:hypothetical protein